MAWAADAGTDYRDPQGRFRLTLPAEWELTPQFGDVDAMRFVRVLPRRYGGGTGALEVRVVPADTGFGTGPDLSGPTRTRTVRSSPVVFHESRQEGLVLETARFDRGGYDVSLTLAYPPRDQRFFEPDFQVMLGSFRPGHGAGRKASPGASTAGPGPGDAQSQPAADDGELPKRLVGTWLGAGGVRLTLGPKGSFQLADQVGSCSFARGTLTVRIPGKPKRFFRIDMPSRDRLLLKQGQVVARYRRVQVTLAGTWSGDGVRLHLAQDGTFRLADRAGRWSRTDDRLTLIPDRGAPITYRLQESPSELRLSGADLDRPLRLRRT